MFTEEVMKFELLDLDSLRRIYESEVEGDSEEDVVRLFDVVDVNTPHLFYGIPYDFTKNLDGQFSLGSDIEYAGDAVTIITNKEILFFNLLDYEEFELVDDEFYEKYKSLNDYFKTFDGYNDYKSSYSNIKSEYKLDEFNIYKE